VEVAAVTGALFLEGETVELRTVEEEDLEAFRDTVNHPEVRRNIGSFRPVNMQNEREWLESLDEENVHLSICVDGETVGNVALEDLGEARRAEIGIMIHPDHHGNGYGTEAARLTVEYGFQEAGFRKIEARVHEGNKASRSIWEKLGFTREGRVRDALFYGGEYVDAYRYGLLRSEWNG
jgi:RimJ/RimL family protein N-acetyltransferase